MERVSCLSGWFRRLGEERDLFVGDRGGEGDVEEVESCDVVRVMEG